MLLFSSIEKNLFSSKTMLSFEQHSLKNAPRESFPDSELSGSLMTLITGGGFRFELEQLGSIKVETTWQWNQFSIHRTCGVFAPVVLCTEAAKKTSSDVQGGMVDWRIQPQSEFVFFIQAGLLARSPNPVEIAGRPDGILPNPELQMESTLAADVGVQTRFGGVSFFLAQDKNLIAAEQVHPLLLRFENTSDVLRRGFSLDTQVQILDFEVMARIEKVWAEVKKGRAFQNVVPFVPSFQAQGLVAKKLCKNGCWISQLAGAKTELDFQQNGSYWLDSQGVAQIAPPRVVGWSVSVPLSTDMGVLETSFNIRNILDTDTSKLTLAGGMSRSVPWSQSPTLPISGRSFELKLRLLAR